MRTGDAYARRPGAAATRACRRAFSAGIRDLIPLREHPIPIPVHANASVTEVHTPPQPPADVGDDDHRSPLQRIVSRWSALWGVRGLVREFALRDLRVRYHQAVLGALWALLMPVLVVLTGLVLRLVVAQSSGVGDGIASLGGIVVRAVGWSFFAGALGFATSSLTASAVLVGKIYFPREALPVATVVAQCVDLAVGILMASVVLLFLGVDPGMQMLWAVPLLVVLVLLTAGVSLLAACANLFFRDVRYLVQVTLTFGIFFTPVFYDSTRLGARGASLVMLNPLAPVLEGLRLSVVDGHSLLQPLVVDGITAWSPWMLFYPAVFAVGCLTLAALLYDSLELTFAEYL